MTIEEISTLLDAKLTPIAQDVEQIRRHLFGNGSPGLRERIGLIEQTCAQRGKEREWLGRVRLAFVIAMGGWIVTLIVLAVENWPEK